MPTAANHDVTFSSDGRFALTVCNKSAKPDIKGIARVFDLVEKKQVAEFEVRHECPGLGTRIALSPDAKRCFVGCYDVYGIACYSTSDGKEIWRRKDLKAVQSVNFLDFHNWVFCGRQSAAAHLLDAKTGETVKKFSGVEEIFGSPFDETIIIRGRAFELHRPLGKKLWKQQPGEKFYCGVYFTHKNYLILEHKLIRCFDISTQELLWSHQPAIETRLFKRFVFNEDQNCFQLFQIRNDAPYVISLDSTNGNVLSELKLQTGVNGDLCLGAKGLFNANLCLFSSENGSLLHDFTTDEILAKDPQYKNQLIQSLADNPMTVGELEKYMKAEGFGEQDIKKALFIKAYRAELARRQKDKQ